jgi:hypothetical protein
MVREFGISSRSESRRCRSKLAPKVGFWSQRTSRTWRLQQQKDQAELDDLAGSKTTVAKLGSFSDRSIHSLTARRYHRAA